MTPGPGDLVGDRYEIVRALGGGEVGRGFVARDRHLDREVVLRLVESGDATTLLEEGAWMAAAHNHSPAVLEVLDVVPTPGGGGYVVTGMVAGTPFEQVARDRAPLPIVEATGYAVELLDVVITLRHHVPGAERAVVASAMVATDGRVRVTRFSRPRQALGEGVDPAVVEIATTLRGLLIGAPAPASIGQTIEDALAGRIATPEELRGRLLAEVTEPVPRAVTPPPPMPAPRKRWPWVVAAVAFVLALIALGLVLALRDDGDSDRATVPDVAGQTAADAVQAVRAAGFSPQTVEHASTDVAEGIVISTTPAGGQSADVGSRVTISVSEGTGTVAVPTVAGLTREAAVSALADAGLESRVVEQASATVPEDTVISQDPGAGLQVTAGSTVALTVSVPAPTSTPATPTSPTVAVPNVVGLSSDAASAALIQAGLDPGTVEGVPSELPEGQVISQDPAAGLQVPTGTAVDIRVASAP